ncbi:diguanylate cyclase domain-containing protein [Alloalcanivorax venustensis]|jgi:GGDEF domain-containing protein|uniref:diguanylate cyclase domain-containing protein n=1 Tax=Alloalcanivorax venustensis TaxID=172371 RepID=UPI003516B0AA|tara:strand:- start:71 stop:826 length:756 start_codon:yes stop_codon:yes gene_type:complete
MTAGTTSIRAQSHSLTPLAQLLSLCQRYRLPLSLLAIQLKDVASLSKQLGGDRLQRLQKQLGQAVQQRTRMEDALIAWQRGYLVLCLPGTRAAGAACVARRLEQWFQKTRFTLDEFTVQLDTAMAVHVANPTPEQSEEQARENVRELLMDTLCLLAAENEHGDGPALSRRALDDSHNAPAITSAVNGRPQRRRDDAANGHASPQQLKDLVDQLRDDDTTLVSTLSPALQRLDERTRMLLIDQLLEASLIPH